MQVREAMAKTISIATPRDSLRRIAELMKMEDAGFIPVCEGDNVVGVITDRDIVIRGLSNGQGDIANEPAERFMSRNVATVQADANLEEAAMIMEQREVRRLPVLENGRLAGILSHGNLVQATRSDGPGDKATLGVTRGA
ncbi:MAG: CBS domain-containing protein [Dehalococcoidia bacterium]|nr:CBS domain-containing protein [Dehalococcoidia bacterium]